MTFIEVTDLHAQENKEDINTLSEEILVSSVTEGSTFVSTVQ